MVPNPVMSPGFSGKPTSPDIGRLQSFMEERVFTGLEVRVRPVSGLHESELLLAADHETEAISKEDVTQIGKPLAR